MAQPPKPPSQSPTPSPNYQGELSRLAETLGLEYPSNPKQINKAVLVLSYLMSKGMLGVTNSLKEVPSDSFYVDDFSKEIHILYYSDTINVYTKSKEGTEYNLGNNPKKDLIEYKIRKELLKLIEANAPQIEDLEYKYYNFHTKRVSPFSWVNEIKSGYYNVLLGGENKSLIDYTNKTVSDLKRQTTKILNITQPDKIKDSINKKEN